MFSFSFSDTQFPKQFLSSSNFLLVGLVLMLWRWRVVSCLSFLAHFLVHLHFNPICLLLVINLSSDTFGNPIFQTAYEIKVLLPRLMTFMIKYPKKRLLISNKSQSPFKVATQIQTCGLITLISRGMILITVSAPSLQIALHITTYITHSGLSSRVP